MQKSNFVLTSTEFAYNIYVEAEASSGRLSDVPVIKKLKKL